MRVLRIDAMAAARADLELHPRLTVLRGATPEILRRLTAVLHSLGRGDTPEFTGLLEVNGVLLALDRETVARLKLNFDGPWVLSEDLSQPKLVEVESDGRSWALAELEAERERLRETARNRAELAEQMERVRARLDSFANAALEVCIGQIDALESRRGGLRQKWERERHMSEEHKRSLEAELRYRRDEVEAVERLDLTATIAARDRLAGALKVLVEPDPESQELALRIDAAMRRLRDQSGLVASGAIRRSEAEQRLAEAVADVSAVQRMAPRRVIDPAVVERLERVRDEMFASEERQSRLSVNRNRKRMAALREEESQLLAELGFDTYSSYVMGIPTMSSGSEDEGDLLAARSRVERIQTELDRLVAEEPSPHLLEASERELESLLARAAELLGGPTDRALNRRPSAANTGYSSFEPEIAPNADAVHDVIIRLRKRQISSPPGTTPEALEAARALRTAVRSLGAGRFAAGDPSRAPRIAATSIIDEAWSGSPQALLVGVDAWLTEIADRSAWLDSARAEIESLESRLASAELDPSPENLNEWAEVESELDKLLDRLVSAQERVRRHEDALVELAELREQELEVRARERELMASIARQDEALRVSENQDRHDRQVGNEFVSKATDLEWELLAVAARRRSVSFVGSLPLVVHSLPDDAELREGLMRLIQRLSDLVQMIVISDDDWIAGWARSSDVDAAVVAFQH